MKFVADNNIVHGSKYIKIINVYVQYYNMVLITFIVSIYSLPTDYNEKKNCYLSLSSVFRRKK